MSESAATKSASEIFSLKEIEATQSRPTNELRWRTVAGANPILQQKWEFISWLGGIKVSARTEWVDVPAVANSHTNPT